MFVDRVGLRKNFLAAAGHSSGALLPLIPNKTTPPHRGSVTCQVASPQIPTKLSPTSTPNAEPPRLRRLHCGKALAFSSRAPKKVFAATPPPLPTPRHPSQTASANRRLPGKPPILPKKAGSNAFQTPNLARDGRRH